LYDAAYFGSLRRAQQIQRKGIKCTSNHSISTAVISSMSSKKSNSNDNGDHNDNEDEDDSVNNNTTNRLHCLRGLESHCDYDPLAFNRRHSLHNLGNNTVLDAQQENGNKSRTTADTDKANKMIASLYTNISASCHLWANVIGMRDQREAELCYDGDDDDDDDDDCDSAVNDNNAANPYCEEDELLVRSDNNNDVEHELLNFCKRQHILLMG
jgi:hypothetical protein